jgi:Tetratricopeptide repeat
MPVAAPTAGGASRIKLLGGLAIAAAAILAAQSWRANRHSQFLKSANEAQLEAAVKENKDDADAAAALAGYKLRAGNKAEAETLLKHAAEITPENPEIWMLLGEAIADDREAINALESFEKLHPENGEIMAAVSARCLHAGDANLAMVNAQKAVQASPDSSLCLTARADAEAATGTAPAAEKDYKAAIERGAGPNARLGLARLLIPLQRFREIEEICSPLLSMDVPAKISREQSARAATYMVGALQAAADTPDNRQRLQKALELMNANEASLPPEERFLPPYFTGEYLLRNARAAEAVPLLQKSVQLGPEFPGSLYSLSRALRLSGKTKEADAALAAHAKLIQRHSAMESAADRQQAQH